jgi:hypothetical protein
MYCFIAYDVKWRKGGKNCEIKSIRSKVVPPDVIGPSSVIPLSRVLRNRQKRFESPNLENPGFHLFRSYPHEKLPRAINSKSYEPFEQKMP